MADGLWQKVGWESLEDLPGKNGTERQDMLSVICKDRTNKMGLLTPRVDTVGAETLGVGLLACAVPCSSTFLPWSPVDQCALSMT